jgi:predicted nucleotidyltransferase
MDLNMLIKQKRKEILRLAAKRGIKNVRVFGSVVRNEAARNSDIDFLVDLEKGQSLLDLGGFLSDVETLLGVNVDVVTEKGLHSYIRDRVLDEAREI